MSNVISTAVSKTLNVVLTQGSAVFNNADNSITLAGIGKDIEIGDVIQVIGAPSNSKEFTVEVITNDNNIIVNQAHAGGTTSKSIVSETATVTVKLLCKWYLAPTGLGQGIVDMTSTRITGVPYTNNTNRGIYTSITVEISGATANAAVSITVDGKTINPVGLNNTGSAILLSSQATVRANEIYTYNKVAAASISGIYEIR